MPQFCVLFYLSLCLFGTDIAVPAARAQEPLISSGGDAQALADTAPQRPTLRVTAPAVPVEYRTAIRTWDGTGELLLAAPSFAEAAKLPLNIGAAFDDVDDPGNDLNTPSTRTDRCASGTLWFRIEDGRLSLSDRDHGPSAQRPWFRSASASGLIFVADHCRYTISFATKVPGAGGWTAAASPPAPRSVQPVAPASSLEGPVSVIFKAEPLPREFHPVVLAYMMGQRIDDALKDRCPRLWGMANFEPNGVFFDTSWSSDPPMTPGIRRDPDARATTLSFQSVGCRNEIRVTREVDRNGEWQASPLWPDPK